MNNDKNDFLYTGLNKWTAQRFLDFSYSEHQCKINLEDDLLENIYKDEDWFLNEFNYHYSVENAKKFVFDFGENKGLIPKELINSVQKKIERNPLMPGNETKSFSLLFRAFLKIFSERKMFNLQFFISEFSKFLIFIFENVQFYRNIFEEYEESFKNFLVLLFELDCQNLYFRIKNDSFLSKGIKDCFFQLAKTKIDKKFENIKENLNFIRDNLWNLFIWIWKFDSIDKKWFSNSLNLLIKNRDDIDPEIFLILLNRIRNEFNDKEIKDLLNFDVNYNTLVEETEKRLPFDWFKFPVNAKTYKLNNLRIILLKIEKSYSKKQKPIMNIFTFLFGREGYDVKNVLTSQFGSMIGKETDFLFSLFEEKNYSNSAYSLFIPGINHMMNTVYLPIFMKRKEFVFNYFESIQEELIFIFKYLKISEKNLQKMLFFIEKLRKIFLKNDHFNDLDLTYDIANYSISIIEYLLLVTYGFTNEFEQKSPFVQLPKINYADKNKTRIKELIRTKLKCEKNNINENLLISINTLDFIYFNLYASADQRGLDFRNIFIHNDWEFSDLVILPMRLIFLTFSIIEEITLKLNLLLIKK